MRSKVKDTLIHALSKFPENTLCTVLDRVTDGCEIRLAAGIYLLVDTEWDLVDVWDEIHGFHAEYVMTQGWSIPLEASLSQLPHDFKYTMCKIGLRMLLDMKDESVRPTIRRIVRWLNNHR